MPIGVLIGALAVAVGSVFGTKVKSFRIAKMEDFPIADMIPEEEKNV